MTPAVVPLAKLARALENVEHAAGLLASACMELSSITGLEADWKKLAALEEAANQARVSLSKKRPTELKHEVRKGCACGCWELAWLLQQHGPDCPAFKLRHHLDWDPELCDPERCEPARRRGEGQPSKAVAS